MLTDDQIYVLLGKAALLSDNAPMTFARAVEAEARKMALEEAASVCVGYGESLDNEWNRNLGVAAELREACEDCAAAIRALANEKP
jgi:hypothetical protein